MWAVDELRAQLREVDGPLLPELFVDLDEAAVGIVALAESHGGDISGIDLVRAGSGLVVGLRGAERRVVVKVHRPHLSRHVAAATRAHGALHAAGLPVPASLLAVPVPLGRGVATVDEWRSEGATIDVRPAGRRRAIAVACVEISEALRPDLFGDLSPTFTGRYRPPHSAIFDFEATTAGAAWIDAAADEALEYKRQARANEVGQLTVLHTDLRPENVLLRVTTGAEAVATTIFDLDSLELDAEPWLVGGVARAFSTNWSETDPMLPTVDEINAFIVDYESARRCPFTADERQLASSGVTYALAYSARCEHALFPDGSDAPWGPGWRHLLRLWCRSQESGPSRMNLQRP